METHLKIASALAWALDNSIGFGKFRFGASALIDLIPGIGDLLDAILSMYLVWIGVKMGLPQTKLLQMLLNIGINFSLGLIPVLGDVGYFFYKSNMRNLKILKNYHSKTIERE